MSKKLLVFILVSVVGLTALFYLKREKEMQICFEDHCFFAEIALTEEQKRTGLMFREKLERDRGMLFIFEQEKKYSFWMKDVLIPLDIIWISQDKKVVYIAENIKPCFEDFCPSIEPESPAKYVFEINGGLVSEIGLSVGNKLEFKTGL